MKLPSSVRRFVALVGLVALQTLQPVAVSSQMAPVSRLASATRCADPQPSLITDFTVRQAPALSEPAARAPFRDPVFGSCLVRVTDRVADIAPDDSSLGLKNEYSRVQSFNADESRILVRGLAATWYLYDAVSLQPLGQLPFGGPVDPRWDATDPNQLYYSEETRLMSYHLVTRQTVIVHDFANDFPGQTLIAIWSRYEGSPSIDGRYWGFMAENENWDPVAFLIYDQHTDRVIAKRDMRGVPGVAGVDNTSISPLGNYFLADFSDSYCEQGQLGTDAAPCGYMVYDRNLQHGRGLLRISGHMDLALDAEGREVAVFQDIDTDQIAMLDLASGVVTPLWPIDFSFTPIGLHFSGRAFKRPGWVVVSTHDGETAAHTWMDDQVFLVELKGRGRIARLAHTRSRVDASQEHDYWAEPQASVNRDLTRILFTSNWGRSGTEQVEMFLIDLPGDWTERLDPDWRVTEIYLATLGDAPDDEGLQYWVDQIETNPAWTPTTVAQSFFDQPLVQQQYPADQGEGSFIDALYQNLFGRAADAAGHAYWLAELTSGRVARNQMIVALIEGGWANAAAATDMARFGNRVTVGLAFADYQADHGIVYSTLPEAEQTELRQAGKDVLAGVTEDPATRDAAIASIPAFFNVSEVAPQSI